MNMSRMTSLTFIITYVHTSATCPNDHPNLAFLVLFGSIFSLGLSLLFHFSPVLLGSSFQRLLFIVTTRYDLQRPATTICMLSFYTLLHGTATSGFSSEFLEATSISVYTIITPHHTIPTPFGIRYRQSFRLLPFSSLFPIRDFPNANPNLLGQKETEERPISRVPIGYTWLQIRPRST